MKYCVKCGKQLADDVLFCAYCGTRAAVAQPAPQAYHTPPQPQQENSMTLAAMICGIISIVAGPVLGIVAMVLAQISKKETGGVMNTQAKVGFYIGLASTILMAVIFILYIYLIVFSVMIL